MKTPIAITLIVMGGLLIMTPLLSDYLFQRNLVELMTAPSRNSGNGLDGKMGDLYQVGCWLTGSVMIGIVILCSIFTGKGAEKQAP